MQGDKQKSLYLQKLLGQIYREIRSTSTNLTCNKAEEEYGISRGHLNRIENGKIDPSLTTMWKAAEANGEKLSYIISLLENKVGENFSLTD